MSNDYDLENDEDPTSQDLGGAATMAMDVSSIGFEDEDSAAATMQMDADAAMAMVAKLDAQRSTMQEDPAKIQAVLDDFDSEAATMMVDASAAEAMLGGGDDLGEASTMALDHNQVEAMLGAPSSPETARNQSVGMGRATAPAPAIPRTKAMGPPPNATIPGTAATASVQKKNSANTVLLLAIFGVGALIMTIMGVVIALMFV